MKNIAGKLKRLDACKDARHWVEKQVTTKPQKLWRKCQRGDWMLWYLSSCAGNKQWRKENKKDLVYLVYQCAKLAIRRDPDGNPQKIYDEAITIITSQFEELWYLAPAWPEKNETRKIAKLVKKIFPKVPNLFSFGDKHEMQPPNPPSNL